MKLTLSSIFLIGLCLSASAQTAKEIRLRTAPEADAPVIAKVTASEKVILDAAPAPRNAELGWRQLALPTPFEGYVPTAAMDKSLRIVEGTPVHYLPTASSARITLVEDGDAYEVVRTKDDWATVRFSKDITGYFIDDTTEAVAIDFDSLSVPLVTTEPVPPRAQSARPARPAPSQPTPVTIPAPRTRVNPDEPISQLDPRALPPENVVWKPAGAARSESASETSRPDTNPASSQTLRLVRRSFISEDGSSQSEGGRIPYPGSQISNPDLMVIPDQTQAREAAPELGPVKTPRLLTGILRRQLGSDGAAYPIRLQSPAGRLIAYVDFSGIYIRDLSPYLDQKVYIRGQIHPLPESSAQLVILAQSLRLAD